MNKKTYFVIQKSNGAYYSQDMFYFESIDDALEAFKYLAKSEKTLEIEYEYINSKKMNFEKPNPVFNLCQKTMTIYSSEEIKEAREIEEKQKAAEAKEKEKNEKK